MRRVLSPLAAPLAAVLATCLAGQGALAQAGPTCPAERATQLLPADPQLCADLAPVIRDPGALPLEEYEEKLGTFLRAFCHRDADSGWISDKHVRDTGPYVVHLEDGAYEGQGLGTHSPVVIWYSPEMADWMRANRTEAAKVPNPPEEAEVPAGAVMVKEMYPYPAADCAATDVTRLLPANGAAVMVRAPEVAHDGWYWGWFGWSGWDPDYPASNQTNRLPYQGFGQYCLNCHASARANMTFADAANMTGEPGTPLSFLSQTFAGETPPVPHHQLVVMPGDDTARLGQPHFAALQSATQAWLQGQTVPEWGDAAIQMPSQTYDNAFMPAGAPDDHGMFLTSDQCVGCHDAGSTGLQFDMTRPAMGEHAGLLWNDSPYGTWRTSPMGLAGRDPIFFAQLASETQSFHSDIPDVVEDTCLGCHGIMGQRQAGIDNQLAGEACGKFTRAQVDATPLSDPAGAGFGALARDGISCMACHRMDLTVEASPDDPANACVAERQNFLNPDNTGFGRTFTGSYPVGAPDAVFGPFKDVKTTPMKAGLGLVPQHNSTISTSEMCGACHTVHLPVLQEGKTLARIYEQLTYPEWAFSDFRTGVTADGATLPFGQGKQWTSCQGCHMPGTNADGTPTVSKIASIQERSNFPQADFARSADEIDLPEREGFSRHVLVGLNVFLVKMAQQFPDVLGIRTQDPMMVSKGVDPLVATEQAMLNQAQDATAKITVSDVTRDDSTLSAKVTVQNLAGHKLPSGVGFRRMFLNVEVLDPIGDTLWASGATDSLGRILGADGTPLPGEEWWTPDCSARIDPLKRIHQPHYQTITSQDSAQIYQELVSTPPAENPVCGHDADPAGQLTTSFLSICAEVKDNRLPPQGYLPESQRIEIAQALGAGADMAQDAGFTATGDDPDYQIAEGATASGADSLTYAIPLAELKGTPAQIRVQLFYQATPPFYLQDRFCTAKGTDKDRLSFIVSRMNLDGTAAQDWKLQIAGTQMVSVPSAQK